MKNIFLTIYIFLATLITASEINFFETAADTANGYALFALNGGGCGLLEHDAATGMMQNASFGEFSRQGINCISLGAYYSSDGWSGNGVKNPNKYLYFHLGPLTAEYTMVLRRQDRFSFKIKQHGNSIDSIAAYFVDRYSNHTLLLKTALKENTWETFITGVPVTSIPVISSFRIYAWSSISTQSPTVPGILSVDDVQVSFGITPATGTSVDDRPLETQFKLFDAYPNPFNPSTTIQYQIPVVGTLSHAEVHVSLKVYDVLGGEVATLVDDVKAPGTYEVKLNVGHAEYNRSMTSGIYFYRLTAGSYTETKKLILMK